MPARVVNKYPGIFLLLHKAVARQGLRGADTSRPAPNS